jgi:hypothetical protein
MADRLLNNLTATENCVAVIAQSTNFDHNCWFFRPRRVTRRGICVVSTMCLAVY